MTGTPANQSSRLSQREKERERGISHTRARVHPERSTAARARLGNADARLQCYAWDSESVWKLYCTRRRRGHVCGLTLLGNVEYFMLRNSCRARCACDVINECVVGSVCVFVYAY